MPSIQISVREKIAQIQDNPEIVCGNSDYTVTFDFDEEWDAYENKTAHFYYLENGIPREYDVIFSGDTVSVPAVWNTCELLVGAYAGDIRTTTAAAIPCIPCITDDEPVHSDPPPDVYAQLLDLLENMQGGSACAGMTSFIIFIPGAMSTVGGATTIIEEVS